MKNRIINYVVVILFIIVSPSLLIGVLRYGHFNDRENQVTLISAATMTIIYVVGVVYIVGFLV